MLTVNEAKEILRALAALPLDKVAEVRDFVLFLQERYGQVAAVDQSDSWSEEDLRDLTAAVLENAENSVWTGESADAKPK
ncbi:MAG: hypothetical protein HY721_23300 [Planctomycetes bacterium]|nr:hypothetical protein [Planctomycetota bacterium]